MAAVALEVAAGRGKPAQEVERRDGAPGPRALLAFERDQDRRPVMALGDPRGHDPDHARMPALGGQDVRGGGALLGHQGLGREAHARLHVAPLGVHRIELGRDRTGARGILGEQQLEPCVGPVEPAGGVDPRREPEADGAGVERARIDAGDLHERAHARLARRRQRAQTLAHEPAVLSHERHDVGHRGEGHEVEILVRERGVLPRPLEQRRRELVRHTGRAQLGARMAADPRVHDRRVGQPAVGARRVMVGHHDVEPRGARRRHLVDGGDRAVDRYQEIRPARREPLDGARGQAVAVVDPARQVPVHVRAQRAQRAHEHRRGRHPVHVVVAVHGDPRPPADVLEHPPGRRPQAPECVERVAFPSREERPRGGFLAQAAPHQHLREHVRDAERADQALGGAVVVGRNGEAGVGPGHGRRSVWPLPDGIRGSWRPSATSTDARHEVVAIRA